MNAQVQTTPIREDAFSVTSAVSKSVSSIGTVRRLRALVAIGHSQTHLAARLGFSAPNLSQIIHGHRERVSIKTHAAVCALFVELWANPVEGRPGERSRSIAKAHGWVGPLAWDDIDDPNEMPDISGVKPGKPRPKRSEQIDEIAVELAMQGEFVTLTRAERSRAVTLLHGQRWSDKYIAATLRITDRTVLRIRQRLELPAFDFSEIRQVENV